MNSSTLPHVSLMVAALCACMQVGLTALVIARRTSTEISYLDGGDSTLLKRMRAHGNFIETVPMALLLLLMLELAGLGVGWLWAMGAAMLASRCLHGWGLMFDRGMFGRVAGTLTMLLLLGCQALACVILFWR